MANLDIERIKREVDRLQLSVVEVAALTGLSVPTVMALRRGRMPSTTRAQRAVEAFLRRASVARSRVEMTLPPAA